MAIKCILMTMIKSCAQIALFGLMGTVRACVRACVEWL